MKEWTLVFIKINLIDLDLNKTRALKVLIILIKILILNRFNSTSEVKAGCVNVNVHVKIFKRKKWRYSDRKRMKLGESILITLIHRCNLTNTYLKK